MTDIGRTVYTNFQSHVNFASCDDIQHFTRDSLNNSTKLYSQNIQVWKSILLGVIIRDNFISEWESTLKIVESTLKRLFKVLIWWGFHFEQLQNDDP